MSSLAFESDRIAALVLTCALGVLAVPLAVDAAAQAHELPVWWTVAALGLAMTSIVWSMVSLIRRSSPARVAALLVAGVSLAMLILVVTPPASRPLPDAPWITSLVPTAVGASTLVSTRLRTVTWLGTLVVGSQLALQASGVWSVTGVRMFTDALFDAALFTTVLAVVLSARSVQARLHRDQQEAISMFASVRAMEGHARANARWDALVHDEVLAALQVIASGHDDSAARSAAARAMAAIREGADRRHCPRLRDALLDTTLESYPLADTEFRCSVDAVEPPPDALDALSNATAEALRNVVRHAYDGRTPGPARVLLVHDEFRVRVEIEDAGAGFVASSVRPAALGIIVAIEERMAAVGGSGRVSSVPGRGTIVTLSWPATP